jgi:hypothetical protein
MGKDSPQMNTRVKTTLATTKRFGPGGKQAPMLSYLKVDFLGHFILRGLSRGFGCLGLAAILFG